MVTAEKGNAVYFVVAANDEIKPVKDHKVFSLWAGSGTVTGWPVDPAADVTLVTVVRRGLDVVLTFVMRLEVRNRRLGQEGIAKALRDADLVTRKPQDKMAQKALAQHRELLPRNWKTQLAVYLDCPAASFNGAGVGGPLALARQTKMTIDQIVDHLLEKS